MVRRRIGKKWKVIMIISWFIFIINCGANVCSAGEKYPNKPIQIVIGYQPGTTDMALRPFTEKLPEYVGQSITFVYKPGASGAIGASFVAKSKPDGYTLIGFPGLTLLLVSLTMKGLDWTFDDFVPVCRVASTPQTIAVKSDSSWETLKDVVEEAKKYPGKFTYSASGTFTGAHVAMERFLKAADIKITVVPCQGAAPAVTALLGGHVNMGISTGLKF